MDTPSRKKVAVAYIIVAVIMPILTIAVFTNGDDGDKFMLAQVCTSTLLTALAVFVLVDEYRRQLSERSSHKVESIFFAIAYTVLLWFCVWYVAYATAALAFPKYDIVRADNSHKKDVSSEH